MGDKDGLREIWDELRSSSRQVQTEDWVLRADVCFNLLSDFQVQAQVQWLEGYLLQASYKLGFLINLLIWLKWGGVDTELGVEREEQDSLCGGPGLCVGWLFEVALCVIGTGVENFILIEIILKMWNLK